MTLTALLMQSLRASWRDARSAEVRLLALALAVAVAALASVGFFVDRAQRALQRDAAAFIGGDVALDSDRPVDEAVAAQADAAGLSVARSVTFPSMAISGPHPERGVLAALKAVSADYPLRGAMMLRGPGGAAAAAGTLAPGAVWVDSQLIDALDLAVGQTIRLGEGRFRVDGVIAAEPDRGAQFFSFAPRVMMRLDELPATDLVQPASRVMYHLQFAGAPAAVQRFTQWLTPRLQGGQRLQTLEQGRPDLHSALDRARQFLTLAALLAAVLAAVAVATAVRSFSQRRVQDCALLRCLGLRPRELLHLFALQFLWIGLAASLAGVAAGSVLHLAIVRALAAFLPAQLPPLSPVPALQALACGLVLLGGLALAPIVRLHKVTPLRVLRRELTPWPQRPAVALYAACAAAFAALLLWLARDVRLAMVTAAGFAGAGLLFAAAAWGWLAVLGRVRQAPERLPAGVAFALAAVTRRPGTTVLQVVALSFGLATLLVMAMVRTDLLRQWRAQVPPDAPDHFIINIQPDQADAVAQRLRGFGVRDAPLYPMIRGRLVTINGRNVDASRFDDERARNLAEREFNLSYMADPPPYNRIVQGRWFGPDAAELSIEQGIARTLGIGLGDRVGFDVAGQIVTAEVTSVRQLSWDSMKVNFFVIMSPALLRDQPQTFITSVHVPPQRPEAVSSLVREFRNLTVIDTGVVLGQVRVVLDQVSRAVQFVFVFALAAGLLVLYAALSASQDERAHQAALVRAFGASRRLLWQAQLIELSALGAMAGLLAGIAANAIGWLLAHQALHFDFHFELAPLWTGALLGIACATAGGTWALRRVIGTPPWVVLREV